MNKKLNYNINLTNLNVVKEDLHNAFFYKGHPEFLIPDFNASPTDIWLGFMDYLEKINNKDIYDQDGGEITSYKFINNNGLVECVYEAYGINFDEDEEPKDYKVTVNGYVILDTDSTYYIAENVDINV